MHFIVNVSNPIVYNMEGDGLRLPCQSRRMSIDFYGNKKININYKTLLFIYRLRFGVIFSSIISQLFIFSLKIDYVMLRSIAKINTKRPSHHKKTANKQLLMMNSRKINGYQERPKTRRDCRMPLTLRYIGKTE